MDEWERATAHLKRDGMPRSWRINPQVPQAAAITPPTGRDWFAIRNAAGDGGPAEIFVYDEVGYFGVNAADFTAALGEVTAPAVNVRINSGGGEVFDGLAIYEALRRHPARVTTYVDSLAASIASVIAMAGDRRVVGKHASLMIHDASGVSVGRAEDMRAMAELLEKVSSNIASVYADRAGGTVKSWRRAMLAETWYDADEAVSAGLATEQYDPDAEFAAATAHLVGDEWERLTAHMRDVPPLRIGE